jgi:hypothetical protein
MRGLYNSLSLPIQNDCLLLFSCLSLIKLEKYNFGILSQLLNNVIDLIFLREEQWTYAAHDK